MKKTMFKKSISLMLTVLMIMSCWIFFPGMIPEAEAVATDSTYRKADKYGTPAYTTANTYYVYFANGNNKLWVYFPTQIHLDVSETLQSAGYKINVKYEMGSNPDYKVLLGGPIWGDYRDASGKPDAYYTMTNIFSDYTVDASVPNGGSSSNVYIDKRGSGDGFTINNQYHDTYVKFAATSSGPPNTANIYLMGTPNSSYKGTTSTFNTAGTSVGSYGMGHNGSNGKDNGITGMVDGKWGQNDGNYKINNWAEMYWEVTIYDKSVLNSTINEANNIINNYSYRYTTTSLNALKNAVNNNKVVLTTRATTQDNINTANTNIRNAINGLKRVHELTYENLFIISDWAWSDSVASSNSSLGAVKPDLSKGTITVNTTGTEVYSSYSSVANHYSIPVKGNTEYRFEANMKLDAGTKGQMFVFFYDANGNGISGAGYNGGTTTQPHIGIYPASSGEQGITFTTPANCTKVAFRFGATEKDTTATYSDIRFYETSRQDIVNVAKAQNVNRVVYDYDTPIATSTVPSITRPGYTFNSWLVKDVDNNGDGAWDPITMYVDGAYKMQANFVIYSDWIPVDVNYENLFSLADWVNAANGANTNRGGAITADLDAGTLSMECPSGASSADNNYVSWNYDITVEKNTDYVFEYDADIEAGGMQVHLFLNQGKDVTGSWGTFPNNPYIYAPTTHGKIEFNSGDYDNINIRFGTVQNVGITNTFKNIRLYKKSRHDNLDFEAWLTEYRINTPSKGSDLYTPTRTGYTFDGWFYDEACTNPVGADDIFTKSTTVYAKWSVSKYTITWKNDDGSVIDTTTVEYGKTPTHADPSKAATAEYSYTFAGWTPAITAVTGNATYTAIYTSTKNKYTITWKNDDGSVIDTTTVEYGKTPTHADPSKVATAEYSYTFAGWTPTVSAVTGNVTYTATYSSAKNKYTVKFVNAAGNTVASADYVYGTQASEINKPVNTAQTYDETNHYDYSWPAVNNVTGNATYTEIKTPTAHTMSSAVTTDSTCTTEGVRTYTCSGCSYSYTEAIEVKAHSWSTTYTSSGNGKDNTHYQTCTVCSAKNTAVAHNWNSGSVTTAATCLNGGIKTYTCTANGCGATYTETIPAKGHTFGGVTAANASTCIVEGNSAYKQCTVCNLYFAENAETNATDGKDKADAFKLALDSSKHVNTIEHSKTPATCLEVGYTAGIFCEDCDKWISGHEEIPAIAHKNKVHHEKVDATCIATGTIEYWYCPDCDKNYSDEACETVVTDLTIAINPDNHDIENHEAKAPTCTDIGWDAYETCKREGCKYTTYKAKPALTHYWSEWVETKAATCLAEGEEERTCKREGCTASETKSIEKLEHKYTGEIKSDGNGKDATHSFKCVNGCNDYGAATKHIWNDGQITDEAACLTGGIKAYTCTANGCGATYTETISAKGHTFGGVTAANASTCIVEGNSAYKQCTVCNLYFAENAETNAENGVNSADEFKLEFDSNNHANTTDYNETPATCLAVGYTAGTYCNDCKKWISGHEEIPAIAHKNKVHHEKVDATCMATGTIEYWYCPDCDKDYSDEACETVVADLTIPVDPDNHDIENHEAKVPTCTDIGWDAYETCKREGCTYTTYKEKEALKHDWSEWAETKEATCLAEGEEKRTCKRDGCTTSETRSIGKLQHEYTGEYKWNKDAEPKTHSQKCINGCEEYGNETACTFSSVVTDPTCYTDGYTTYTCTVCNNSYEDDITTRQHKYIYLDGNGIQHTVNCEYGDCDYTATENCSGGTADCVNQAVCEKCNTVWGNALGHEFVRKTASQDYLKSEANCTDAAVYYISCSRCYASSKGEDVEFTFVYGEALGHSYDYTKGTPAEAGKHIVACTKCAEGTDGHTTVVDCTFDDGVITEPTCTKGGYTTHTCKICSYSYTDTETEAKKHVFGQWGTVNGVHTRQCTVCTDEEGRVETGDCEYNEWTQTKAPTCEGKGEKAHTCTICNDTVTAEIDPIKHNYGEWTFNEDTGKHERICGNDASHIESENCADSATDDDCKCDKCGNLVAHDYGEASCDAPATCKVCGEKTGEALGHSFTTYVSNNDATCEKDGTKTAKCDRCDVKNTITDEGSALDHNFTEFVETVDYTCTTGGYDIYKCSRCDETTTNNPTQAAHRPETDYTVIKKATCDADGYKAILCSKCKEELSTQPIAKREHKYVDDNVATPATCIANGVMNTYCSNVETATHAACSSTSTRVIPATGHNFGDVTEYKAPTCTETGNEAYKQCASCKLYFAANAEINSAEGKTTADTFILATNDNHNFATEFTVDEKATCDAVGSKSKHCSRCGAKTEVTEIPARGHNIVDEDVAQHATCLEAGVMNQKCNHIETDEYEACGYTTTRVIPATGHTFGDVTAYKAPTCIETGNEAYKQCENCNLYFAENAEIYSSDGKATADTFTLAVNDNHDFATEFTVDKKATCDEAGSKSRHCSRCGVKTEVTEIPARGHNIVDADVAQHATCLEAGVMNQKCNHIETDEYEACGYTTTRVIPATGHNFGAVTEYKAPTCTETGNEAYKQCTACNLYFAGDAETNSAEGKATADAFTLAVNDNHDFATEFTVDEKAACDEAGSKSRHCSRCEATTEVTFIPARGHNIVDTTVAKDATCLEVGVMNQKCDQPATDEYEACTHTTTRVIPATGHTFGDVTAYKAPTCIETGNEAYKQCTACNLYFAGDAEKFADGGKADTSTFVIAVNPDNHTNLIKTDAVANTCETDGNIDYWTCEGCKKIYSDENAVTQITSEQTVLTAKGHNYDTTKSEANLTRPEFEDGKWTQGYYTYTCKNDATHKTIEKVDRASYNNYEAAWNALSGLLSTDLTADAKQAIQEVLDSNDISENLIISEQNIVDIAEAKLKSAFEQHKGSLMTYTVTFVINGKETATTVISGQPATAPTNTAKESDSTYHYTFSGWDKDFTNITADITVTAQYNAVAHSYTKHTPKDDTYHTDICECGYSKDAGHTETSTVTKATCENDGVITYTCSVCQGTRTETIEKRAHNYIDNGVATPATCLANGVMNTLCSNTETDTHEACNSTSTRVINATGHTFGAVTAYKASDCVNTGNEAYKQCTACKLYFAENAGEFAANGKADNADFIIDALKHDFASEFSVDVKATCEAAGSKSRHCSRCGAKTEVTEIPARGHNIVDVDVAQNATCLVDGTMNQKCNHIETDEYEACGYTTTKVIPATGHNFGAVTEYKAPTCTETGNNAYKQCTACNLYFADGAETNSAEGKTTADTFILATNDNHNFATEFTVDEKATCDAVGSKSKHCSRCGAKTEVTEIPARGHNIVDVDVAQNATCLEAGVMNQKCNHIETDEYEACEYTTTRVIPATGHNFGAVTEYKAPTCTETGNEAYKQCIACKLYFAGDAEEFADGGKATADAFTLAVNDNHDFATEFTVDKKATCDEAGSKSRHCSRCGVKTEVTEISARGHNIVDVDVAQHATCLEAGVMNQKCNHIETDEYEACEYTTTSVIPATGHNFGAVTEYKAPTCTETGNNAYKQCESCKLYFAANAETNSAEGKENTDEFILLPDGNNHDFSSEFTVDIKATCDKVGSKSRHCSRCDATTEVTVIATRSHNLVDTTVEKAATCLEAGIMNQKCDQPATDEYEACTHTTTRVIAKLEHVYTGAYVYNAANKTHAQKCANGCETYNTEIPCTFDDGVVTDPTCVSEGYTTYTCQYCDGSYKDNYITADGHDFSEWKYIEDTDTHQRVCNNDSSHIEIESCVRNTDYSGATCTQDGIRSDKCKDCGNVKTTAYPALGHDFINDEKFIVYIDATCTEAGSVNIKCIRCDTLKKTASIEPKGHKYFVTAEATAPTCTLPGRAESMFCMGCGYEVIGEVIPATGHSVNEDGQCEICGAQLYEDDKYCECICHSTSFLNKIIYKIVKFFWKIFKMKQTCACGFTHY